MIQKAPNVTIQHVVHALPRQGNRERIQRLVRTASQPAPGGEAPKVCLIDLAEARDHGLVDHFVLSRRDPPGALPPIGLRDVDAP